MRILFKQLMMKIKQRKKNGEEKKLFSKLTATKCSLFLLFSFNLFCFSSFSCPALDSEWERESSFMRIKTSLHHEHIKVHNTKGGERKVLAGEASFFDGSFLFQRALAILNGNFFLLSKLEFSEFLLQTFNLEMLSRKKCKHRILWNSTSLIEKSSFYISPIAFSSFFISLERANNLEQTFSQVSLECSKWMDPPRRNFPSIGWWVNLLISKPSSKELICTKANQRRLHESRGEIIKCAK